MAWRPTSFVIEGELDNTTPGWTVGWIRLEGREELLQLKLAGNCHPDLAGWKFRIIRLEPDPDRKSISDIDSAVDYRRMATDQSGLIGDVTADQMRRHFECSTAEFLAKTKLGCPPPTIVRPALYVEWFSNVNGRVVIESTRLGVERIGERLFELSPEQFIEQASKNRQEMEFFMLQAADALSRHDEMDGGNVGSDEVGQNEDENRNQQRT